MRVEEMTAAHYLAFKEKLVPMETGEQAAAGERNGLPPGCRTLGGAAGCRCLGAV